MNLDKFNPRGLQSRPRIEVLFEFSLPKPKPTLYRAVQATDGSFRMEKCGQNAKSFRTIMWCGSEDGLHRFRADIEFQFRK